jgi:hypothetical protein
MQSFLMQNQNQGGQQMTPDQRQQAMLQQFQQQIMGQPAQNAMQGATQLATGMGTGLANYANQPQNQFPGAPMAGGATANPTAPAMSGMNFGSLFNFGNKGMF